MIARIHQPEHRAVPTAVTTSAASIPAHCARLPMQAVSTAPFRPTLAGSGSRFSKVGKGSPTILYQVHAFLQSLCWATIRGISTGKAVVGFPCYQGRVAKNSRPELFLFQSSWGTQGDFQDLSSFLDVYPSLVLIF